MLRPKMEPGRLQNRCQNRMVFKVLKKSPSEGLRGPTAEGSRAASFGVDAEPLGSWGSLRGI